MLIMIKPHKRSRKKHFNMTKKQKLFYKKHFKTTIKQIKAYTENNFTYDQERIHICCDMLYTWFQQFADSPFLLEYLYYLEKKHYIRSTFKDAFLVGILSGLVSSIIWWQIQYFASLLLSTIICAIGFFVSFFFFGNITFLGRGTDFLIEDWERNTLSAILMAKTKHPMP